MSRDPAPLVSVVTPVYNGEPYLAACIESVLAQTYSNWEYVVVNNRSTDGTREIAAEYARRDPRIRVVDNAEFLGVMENGNEALRRISPASRYCKVVHADDWLFPECLERMVEVAEAHPRVGIVGSYALFGTRIALDGLPYPSTVVPGREVGRRVLLGELAVFGSPSSLLLRSDLVRAHDPFYRPSDLHSDVSAALELLRDADFGFVHQVLTFTRIHEESQTARVSQKLHAAKISRIRDLHRFGPAYLKPAELQARTREVHGEYYRFLGRNLLRRRDRRFWDFHREELRSLGQPLDRARVLRAWLGHAAGRLLNPEIAVRRKLLSRP